MILDVTLIGAGNVAHHLGKALHSAGVTITQVYSRNNQKSKYLADLVSSEPISDFASLRPSGLVILAVSDQAISQVSALIAPYLPPGAFVVHTSGATPSAVIAAHFSRYGVFYPLQSFSIVREVDFREVPLCIHAANEDDHALLVDLGRRISGSVHRIDDAQRLWLHMTAVVVNNFPNHLFRLAEQILTDHELSLDLLRPLILETARKVQQQSPAEMQTGPARRGDQVTIDAHLHLLEDYPQLREVYETITESIRSMKNEG